MSEIMKSLVLLVVTIIVGCNADIDPVENYINEIINVHKECLKSSEISRETVLDYFFNTKNVDTPQLRNYLLCASKKKGYRNDAGVYQPEAHKKSLMKMLKDETTVDNIIKKCAQQKSTPEESVIETSKCFEGELYEHLSKKLRQKLIEINEDCKKETGVAEEAVMDQFNGKESSDSNIKKYSVCVLKKLHVVNDAGEFNEHAVKTYLYLLLKDVHKVREIYDKCCKKFDTLEETSYQYIVCRFKTVKKQ